jgi:hypothetical protein
MPRNLYFSQGVKSEQNLYEDIVTEAIKMYGFEVYYLPRNMVSRDMILNEDIESKFDAAYMLEMYIENVDGFDGEGTLFSKFGLEIRDQATFVVSKRVWQKMVGFWNNGIISNRPAEGDLLYFPLTRSMFEIKFVEHQSPFYQLSKVPVYKLQCELFETRNEEISTGIDELDAVQRDYATEYVFDIIGGNGTQFQIGEMVTQTVGIGAEVYAKVLRFEQSPASQLRIHLGQLSTNTGSFNLFKLTTGISDKLVGQKSGAQWSISKIYDTHTVDLDRTFVSNNQGAQNHAFEQEADAIIDFTENNPFGDPTA